MASMNPCAVEFTPIHSPSPARGNSRPPSAPRADVRRRRRSQAMDAKDKSPRETSLDPENYDEMFPVLSNSAAKAPTPAKQARTPSDQTSKGKAPRNVTRAEINGAKEERDNSEGGLSTREEATDMVVTNEVVISDEAAEHLLSKSFEDVVLLKPTVYKPPPRRTNREKARTAVVSPAPDLPSTTQRGKQNQHAVLFPPTPVSEAVLPLTEDGSLPVDSKLSPSTPNPPPQTLPQQFAPEVVITPPPGHLMPYYFPPPLMPYDPTYGYPVIWNTDPVHPSWVWTDPRQSLLAQFPMLPAHTPSPSPHPHYQAEANISRPQSSSSMTQHTSGLQPDAVDPSQPQETTFEDPNGIASGRLQAMYSHRPSHPGEYLTPHFRPVGTAGAMGRTSRTRSHRRARSTGPSKMGGSSTITKSDRIGGAETGHATTLQQDRSKGFNWAYYPHDERPGPNQAVQGAIGEVNKTSRDPVVDFQRDGMVPNTITPPLNAPTAPASLRPGTKSPTAQGQQATLAINTSEPGKWSQSKRWMSQETKERVAFQKTMLNLHYMRADKSPFVPQTPAELTALKAEVAEMARKRLDREIDKILTRSQLRKESGVDDQGKVQPLMKLFDGRRFQDTLSPFFALQNCFNEKAETNDEEQADWPSLAELKEEGDKRAGRFGGYFPLPRLNVLASKFVGKDGENAYSTDGSVRWDKRAIKETPYLIMPLSLDPEEDDDELPFEPELEDLPFQLRLLIDEIDKEGSKESIYDMD